MFKKIILASLFLILVAACGVPLAATAQGIVNPGYVSEETGNKPYDTGNYTLTDILALAVKYYQGTFGLIGAIALLMFVWGGIEFLISAGSSEKVEKAKKRIIAAVVGLILVFASYLIVKFVFQSLGINWKGGTEKLTETPQIISILK